MTRSKRVGFGVAPRAVRPTECVPVARYVGLVGCGKAKRPVASPACELYTGGLTRTSIEWVVRNCDHYFILSAKYGLLRPDQIVAPYNVKMSDLTPDQKHLWSFKVLLRLHEHGLNLNTEYVALAGSDYITQLPYEIITPERVLQPCKGMKMGLRLKWLKEHPYLTEEVVRESEERR